MVALEFQGYEKVQTLVLLIMKVDNFLLSVDVIIQKINTFSLLMEILYIHNSDGSGNSDLLWEIGTVFVITRRTGVIYPGLNAGHGSTH